MGGYGLTYTDISDNILYSGKSYSISNGDLFDICNDTVTTVLETILDYLNDFATDAPCLVKVSATDDVCNYLFNKLESTDNSVTITKSSITVANVTTETVNLSVGANLGSNIIYSDTTTVTLTATGTYDSYSIPAGTLMDGDLVEIEACLFMDVPNVPADNFLNINSAAVITASYGQSGSARDTYIKFNCEFLRLDELTIYFKSHYSVSIPGFSTLDYFSDISTISVSNLDTNPLPIVLDVNMSGPTNSFDFKYMIIKHTKAII